MRRIIWLLVDEPWCPFQDCWLGLWASSNKWLFLLGTVVNVCQFEILSWRCITVPTKQSCWAGWNSKSHRIPLEQLPVKQLRGKFIEFIYFYNLIQGSEFSVVVAFLFVCFFFVCFFLFFFLIWLRLQTSTELTTRNFH